MKLALQLLSYKGEGYLPYLFEALKNQTFKDWKLFFLDNGSVEPHTSALKRAVAESGLPIEFFRVETNLGFAGGHDFLFEKTRSAEYVMLVNDDAFIEPEYITRCLAYLETHPECAAAEGVILRWDFGHLNDAGGRTQIVDSLWLVVKRDFSIHDIGMGKPLPAAQSTHDVFGVTGCLPIYRVSALMASSPDKNIFDPTYFAYKEDMDLAFRLRAAGYTAALIGEALGYHQRGYGENTLLRQKNSASYLSYRNHLWLLLAHLRWRDIFWKRICVIPYEKLKFIYWLLRKPSFVFNAWRETRANWKYLMAKRAWLRGLSKTR
jgi:GT2 family glycosyltransferase